jgi:hypothetical protein
MQQIIKADRLVCGEEKAESEFYERADVSYYIREER